MYLRRTQFLPNTRKDQPMRHFTRRQRPIWYHPDTQEVLLRDPEVTCPDKLELGYKAAYGWVLV